MKDQSKTKQVLIQELSLLRQKVAELEQSESERKNVEEALRESQERYRTVARLSSEFAYSCIHAGDDGYEVDWITDAFFTITGYSEAELHEQRCWLFVSHPDDREMATKPLHELKVGESDTREFRIVNKGGRVLNIINHMECQVDPKAPGGLRLFGAVQDITERKREEQELLLKNLIFEASITANSIADIKGNLTHANSSFIRMWGYENKEEVIGKPIRDFLKFEHETRKIITALNENSEWTGEYTALRRDGTTFNAYTQATIVTDESGNTIGYQSTVLDITERKHMEAALRESEEHYRLLFENSPVGIFVYDTRLRFVNCNDLYLTMLRTTRDRIIGLDIAMLKDPIALPVFQLPLEGKCGSYEGPYHTTTSDIVIWISVYTAPLLDGEGRIVGGIGIQEDITDHKLAEEALRQSEENFRRSLADSPLGVRIVTIEGETIYANRTILDIYGYDSVEELETTPAVNRYTPESFAEYQIRREKRKQGGDGPSEYEISIVRKNGEIHHLQVFRKEILWDGERQFQVLYQDVTERKQAEEALRESRDEIQWLFKSMINAFVIFESVFDDNGHFISYRFIYINDAYERITGVKIDEVKGKTVHEVWPETEPEWIKRYGEVAVTGITQIFDLYHEPTKKFYHCNVYRPWDTKDRFCVIFEDITERKRMEEEKHHMEERSRKVVEDIFRFIPEGVLVFSRKMELLRQNQAFRDLVTGYARRLGFAEDELENLIIDKIKAGLRDNNIKEIKITRKHEIGKQT